MGAVGPVSDDGKGEIWMRVVIVKPPKFVGNLLRKIFKIKA